MGLIINNLFKCMCIVTTGFMVGYWIYKFIRNEDITVIEYNSAERIANVIYPELTICLQNPFLTQKMKEINKFLDPETYLKYLAGEAVFNETYQNIDYDHVTVDLYDHLQTLEIVRRDYSLDTCSDKNNCSFAFLKNTYNGFRGSLFFKCFALDVNVKGAKNPAIFALSLTFNVTLKNGFN